MNNQREIQLQFSVYEPSGMMKTTYTIPYDSPEVPTLDNCIKKLLEEHTKLTGSKYIDTEVIRMTNKKYKIVYIASEQISDPYFNNLRDSPRKHIGYIFM